MAHPFDEAVDAVRQRIMDEPGLFHVAEIEARGARWRAFDSAPLDLPAFFELCCSLYPDRECLVDGADRLTFSQTLALARRFAAGLILHHHVKPGDHVGLAARNGAGWVIGYMGIVMAGGVATLVNAFWTGPEMAEALRDVECSLILADRFRYDALQADGARTGAGLALLDLDLPLADCLAPFLGDAEGVAFPALGPDAPATLLFTSGSTGVCKGALSDHRAKVQAVLNFTCSVLSVSKLMEAQGKAPAFLPATLLNLPLFHVTGEVVVMLQSFTLGRKMVVMRRWDAHEALRLVEAERITYITGVPLMGLELAMHPDRQAFDLSSLTDIAAGGAPRPVEQVVRLREGLPDAWPSFGFGLTETNAVGAGIMRDAALAHPGSPGLATPPLVDLAIFADDGARLGANEEGEVGVRSIANISGYWNRSADNARLFSPDGHVMTGDLGRLDDEGYLTIVGRKKDIVIRGGENIACPEVEAALYGIKQVRECAVFGVPDARFGEVLVAVVHVEPGSGLDDASIGAALSGRLASYKRPSRILFSDEALPRLGSEKIDKRGLRDAYLAKEPA